MKYFDVCTKRTYKAKDGQEKTVWLKCGTFKETDEGKRFLELNHLPDIHFYIFEQKKKEESGGGSNVFEG